MRQYAIILKGKGSVIWLISLERIVNTARALLRVIIA